MINPPDRLKFANKQWTFHSAPNVRRMLRRVFACVSHQNSATVTLSHTSNTAREIDWFIQRYPHEMDDVSRMVLTETASAAKEREIQCASILAGHLGNIEISLAKPARQYQQIAVELTAAVGGLLCGDDLGLGKTVVGIALATIPSARPMVVLCEKHLQRQWKNKFKEFAPDLKVAIAKTSKPEPMKTDVLIMTYGKCKGWAGHIHPAALVLDEIQALRAGDKTDRYKAVQILAEGTIYRLGLSATPVFNYGGEIWNILEILRPGALGTASEFIHEWCSTTDGGKWIVDDPAALGAFLRQENLMIRRVRADVGRELPKIQQFAELVPYSTEIMDELEDEALGLAHEILHGSFTQKGQAGRLLDSMLRQATGLAKAPFVAALVADMVRAGKKVVLAGWHREVYTIWQRTFAQEDIKNWMYTGSESEKQKDDAAREFIAHEGGGVFILSLRSGAGLDGLQAVCDTVVFGELDWSPQTHIQLIGRLQRDGLCNPAGVSVFFLVADAGSDPIIAGVLGVKMEQGAGITDPEMSLEDQPLSERLSDMSFSTAAKNPMAALAQNFIARHSSKPLKEAA